MGIRLWLLKHDLGTHIFLTSSNRAVRTAATQAAVAKLVEKIIRFRSFPLETQKQAARALMERRCFDCSWVLDPLEIIAHPNADDTVRLNAIDRIIAQAEGGTPNFGAHGDLVKQVCLGTSEHVMIKVPRLRATKLFDVPTLVSEIMKIAAESINFKDTVYLAEQILDIENPVDEKRKNILKSYKLLAELNDFISYCYSAKNTGRLSDGDRFKFRKMYQDFLALGEAAHPALRKFLSCEWQGSCTDYVSPKEIQFFLRQILAGEPAQSPF